MNGLVLSCLICVLIISLLITVSESRPSHFTNLFPKKDKGNKGMDRQTDLKYEWPHLSGVMGEDAKASISSDRPDVRVHVVPQNTMVTMDYREDRVRIYVDTNGKVVGIPRVG